MKFRTLLRHLKEGCKNIIRNGWMSFASISSIFISLFLLGAFMLLALNVNNFASSVESKVEIRVFLQLDIDKAKMKEVENKILALSEVKQVTLVTKEEGLEELRKNLSDEGLLDGYDEASNPLPDSFTVEVFKPQSVSSAAAQIEALNTGDETVPITSVKYGEGKIETLFKITNAVRTIGLVIVLALTVTAMFLISNTIKVTIVARRREIGIMKLVGATNAFIRWPFFIEGALIGLIASILTTAVLLVSYAQFVQVTQEGLGLMMLSLVSVQQVGLEISGVLIGLGTLIGIWGSTISIRKYLKV
ncbi:permease-like cell division protein FtsX [Paenibacillus sp. KS-LC4]|uniref:permease-like cell division protein FtsX n=1 Tax=Paenibacillus sp. KS-LC4 TaxID=2979727 RepID=UPI0030D577DC